MKSPGACRAGGFYFFLKALIAGTAALLILAAAINFAAWAQAPSDLEAVFGLFDTNGDGVIDRTEFGLKKVMVFPALDRNQNNHLDRDGKISGLEFVETFGRFETIDADGDGLVTVEEFRAYVEDLRS